MRNKTPEQVEVCSRAMLVYQLRIKLCSKHWCALNKSDTYRANFSTTGLKVLLIDGIDEETNLGEGITARIQRHGHRKLDFYPSPFPSPSS